MSVYLEGIDDMKRLFGLIAIFLILTAGQAQAGIPKISNLQFSANPATIGEQFIISFEFEGDIDRLFIENTWETQGGEIKREVKEFTIPREIKEKQNGLLTREWKVVSGAHRPYRILKVWVKDAGGNQSNTLSQELRLAKRSPMVLEEKCEAPIWNIGDKWKFKDISERTWTTEVLDIKEDLFIIKAGRAQDLWAYDKKTLNVKYLIEQSGRRVKSTSSDRKLFDFPITIGKKWTDTITGTATGDTLEVTYVNEFKIEGTEEVTTAAGRFNAYRIHYKQTNLGPTGASGWVRFWYSPEVKNWIKREFDKSPLWVNTRLQNAELISYHLK